MRADPSMALIVQKFGGTSMGTIERIKNAASRTLAAHRAGDKVVVIVSAMSGETSGILWSACAPLLAQITSYCPSGKVSSTTF